MFTMTHFAKTVSRIAEGGQEKAPRDPIRKQGILRIRKQGILKPDLERAKLFPVNFLLIGDSDWGRFCGSIALFGQAFPSIRTYP
jgi:hypothetical protein